MDSLSCALALSPLHVVVVVDELQRPRSSVTARGPTFIGVDSHFAVSCGTQVRSMRV